MNSTGKTDRGTGGSGSSGQGVERRGFWRRLKDAVVRFFWGTRTHTPCVLGRTQEFVDHWMIGPHSWGPEIPCEAVEP
jgi:hypothetical protein